MVWPGAEIWTISPKETARCKNQYGTEEHTDKMVRTVFIIQFLVVEFGLRTGGEVTKLTDNGISPWPWWIVPPAKLQ